MIEITDYTEKLKDPQVQELARIMWPQAFADPKCESNRILALEMALTAIEAGYQRSWRSLP